MDVDVWVVVLPGDIFPEVIGVYLDEATASEAVDAYLGMALAVPTKLRTGSAQSNNVGRKPGL
ncbi:hypothetical protein AB4Z18_13875 [Leifsonia sp. 2TAF2]|uniref:hypothetical protein n=1 Tax=Leifsonia sp. 2TAF2 TaxID=3233009 RepID=UPI003F9AA2A5